MKKLFYLSTAAILLFFPSIANAQSSSDSDLTPSEVFCSNKLARNGSAITEINRMLNSKSSRLSAEEREVLSKMVEILDTSDTIKTVCSPAEF